MKKLPLCLLLLNLSCLSAFADCNCCNVTVYDQQEKITASERVWDKSWRSPKGQDYFDCVVNKNVSDKIIVCSVCGSEILPYKITKDWGEKEYSVWWSKKSR